MSNITTHSQARALEQQHAAWRARAAASRPTAGWREKIVYALLGLATLAYFAVAVPDALLREAEVQHNIAVARCEPGKALHGSEYCRRSLRGGVTMVEEIHDYVAPIATIPEISYVRGELAALRQKLRRTGREEARERIMADIRRVEARIIALGGDPAHGQ